VARFEFPTNATLHTANGFLGMAVSFSDDEDRAEIIFHPRYMHMEPFALAMAASWGEWCGDRGLRIAAKNLGDSANYAWRMKLFDFLPGVAYNPGRHEFDETGRFVPLRAIKRSDQINSVIGEMSALLHLDDDEEALSAVQYCMSELLRNSLEHSGARGGAFVCAHHFHKAHPKRVHIAVADCGVGVTAHIGGVYPAVLGNHQEALRLAMRPNVTGARPGLYGSMENQGNGLFITRAIAKGTGGHFLIYSGEAGYRLARAKVKEQTKLHEDAFQERNDVFNVRNWLGTVVALEIVTERIPDFKNYFQWILKQVPPREASRGKIRFT
jgi:hypothetical protein